MSLYKTDLYISERSYPLDEVQMDTLVYLYQPLIGTQAFSLYMMLYNEAKRMDRFHKACALSRLVMFLNINLDEIEKALKALEAIGLLRTYFKNVKDQVTYLYSLQSPLSLKSYFSNQILVTLLKQTLGKEEFDKTRYYFRIAGEDKKIYEESTAKFSDVFMIDLSLRTPLRVRDQYLNYNEGSFDVDYDLTLFYEALKDFQVSRKTVAPHERTIKQLGTVYSVDALTLAGMVRESISNNQLDEHVLSEKIKSYYSIDTKTTLKEIYHKQPEQYKIHEQTSSALLNHLRYLESISPYDLLKSKQGGKEPVLRDLMIAETLMVQLGLTPGVTNVLLEYVLGKNDGRLPRGYCETIGSSWARKHIRTAKQAYEAAMQVEPEKEVVEKKVEPGMQATPEDQDELIQMLNRLKGEEE